MINLDLHKFCLVDTIKYKKMNIAISFAIFLGVVTGTTLAIASLSDETVGVKLLLGIILSLVTAAMYIMVGNAAIKTWKYITSPKKEKEKTGPMSVNWREIRHAFFNVGYVALYIVGGIVVLLVSGSLVTWVFDPNLWWDAEDPISSLFVWLFSGVGMALIGLFAFALGAIIIEKYGDCKERYEEWLTNQDV